MCLWAQKLDINPDWSFSTLCISDFIWVCHPSYGNNYHCGPLGEKKSRVSLLSLQMRQKWPQTTSHMYKEALESFRQVVFCSTADLEATALMIQSQPFFFFDSTRGFSLTQQTGRSGESQGRITQQTREQSSKVGFALGLFLFNP